jgi:hypothetical protein
MQSHGVLSQILLAGETPDNRPLEPVLSQILSLPSLRSARNSGEMALLMNIPVFWIVRGALSD